LPTQKSGDESSPGSVRHWLERQIRNGVFAPGDRIDEQEVCRRFGLSRTPVREALLQLSTLNLVTFKSRHGAVVTRLTVREIVAMWEVLTCLEGFCASLAARRITEVELKELRKIHASTKELVANGDTEAYANANQSFHEIMYRATKNDYLSDQVRDIRSRLQAYRRYPFSRIGGLERSVAGHEAVLTALEAGDDHAASAAMTNHVASAMSFVDLIAEIPDEARGEGVLHDVKERARDKRLRPSARQPKRPPPQRVTSRG
jgi:DNA-binding GntR family transcriptional regulator